MIVRTIDATFWVIVTPNILKLSPSVSFIIHNHKNARRPILISDDGEIINVKAKSINVSPP